ncbi:MAG: HAMP domain-containing sensor histidine kinase [Phascolarctobacterium sp.]|nr:HAMP domain-containing sensor histidine kinase [Phascolarctobacterium sp.]
MWSSSFAKLQKKLTLINTLISFILIITVVATSYTLIWMQIIDHEKEELVATIYHEAEEWISSKEPPCNETSINDGSMLAYFLDGKGETVILNQMGETPKGKALLREKALWPTEFDKPKFISTQDENGNHVTYLVCLGPVKDGDKLVGQLYMFEDIHFYYHTATEIFLNLLVLIFFLLIFAFFINYFLAGKNIKPVREMYSVLQQFTADASHEMRTPLAVTRLAVEAIRDDEDTKLSEFAEETFEMIDGENQRMTNLTENLMSLARSDTGNINMEVTDVDITELCTKVAKKLSLVAKDRGFELSTDIASPLFTQGNANALEHLLIILLDNSFKYSPSGTTVQLKAYKHNTHIVIDVIDEGEGISDENKKHIFDWSFRVDKARSRQQGGLGLGLSLAHAIITFHNGEIFVLDNKPKGTIMRVKL